jgi:hypothetical protein
MLLRLKIGFYAGEIREFPFTVARDLLKNGRAEDPFAKPFVAAPELQLEPAKPVERTGKRGRR